MLYYIYGSILQIDEDSEGEEWADPLLPDPKYSDHQSSIGQLANLEDLASKVSSHFVSANETINRVSWESVIYGDDISGLINFTHIFY